MGTFATPVITQPRTPIGGGLSVCTISASFSGTLSTLTVSSPILDVTYVHLVPITSDFTDASTTHDRFLLNNTANASGVLNMIATSTNNSDTTNPCGLKWTRGGTNSQDVLILIIGKG